jgi:aspartate aminotransferase
VDDLERAATPRTRGLMLNSPCNPTGAVYSRDEMAAVIAFAHRRGWWVISDEIYRRIAYDGAATGALQVAESRDNLIVVDGVAKAYAMTGWRIGWSITQKPLAAAMSAFQSHTTSNAAAVSQHAALAALTDGAAADAAVAAMVAQFRSRRDAALAVLAEDRDIRVVRPDGAFYLFIEAPGAGRGEAAGDAFAATLLETHDVAAVPGAAFLTPDWIRVSYAAAEDLVLEGVRRIAAAHRAHR